MTIKRVGIVGGGAWGTALATAIARADGEALIWARELEVVASINEARVNAMFLPDVGLPSAITATEDLADMAKVDAVLMVTPAQALRQVATALASDLKSGCPVALCSKGIEAGTNLLMSQVLDEVLPQADAMVLSGPSFAADVARGLPTAVTLAGPNADTVASLAEALKSTSFRPYLSDDAVGAQIGGAVKNVLAIACGIVDGRKLGASAKAALITRGFAEMIRFGTAHGAQQLTMNGLSGLGDLVLTCSSPQSRNMSLGMAIGEGRTLDEILGERRSVSEGVYSASVVTRMAADKGIEMPIVAAVDRILNHGAEVDTTIAGLLSRPIKTET